MFCNEKLAWGVFLAALALTAIGCIGFWATLLVSADVLAVYCVIKPEFFDRLCRNLSRVFRGHTAP